MENSPSKSQSTTDSLIFPSIKMVLKPERCPLPCYAKLYQKSLLTGSNWILFACTNLEKQEVSPTFEKSIALNYNFSQDQLIRVEVYQLVEDESILYSHVEFTLLALVKSPGKTLIMNMKCPNSLWLKAPEETLLVVFMDEPLAMKDSLILQIGLSYNKMTFFKRASYFTMWRIDEGGEMNHLLSSELVSGRNVEFVPMKIKITEKFKREGILRVGIYDKNHKPKGYCEFTYADIIEKEKKEFKMLKFDRKKSMQVEKGTIRILNKTLDIATNFCDYINAGLELQTIMGIDYSYYSVEEPNESSSQIIKKSIQSTIKTTTTLLEPYLAEKKFTLYGLGGKLDSTHEETFFPFQNFTRGITGPNQVLNAFEQSFLKLKENKKLFLAPFVQQTVNLVKETMGKASRINYFICFIVITGPIKDFYVFVDQMVLASYEVPLSFLILGIGEENFGDLEHLNNKELEVKGSYDRSQFRRNFRLCFEKDFPSRAHALAELLNEIPRDVIEFIDKMKMIPEDFKKPTPTGIEEIEIQELEPVKDGVKIEV